MYLVTICLQTAKNPTYIHAALPRDPIFVEDQDLVEIQNNDQSNQVKQV